jgi:hypothetical protein
MARPPVNLDWARIEQLASTGTSGVGIARICGVAEDTLRKRCKKDKNIGFSEFMRQKREVGFSSIRMKQYQVALAGNPSMLIWLGKQYLDQNDKGVVAAGDDHEDSDDYDMSKLSDDELKVFKAILQKAKKST